MMHSTKFRLALGLIGVIASAAAGAAEPTMAYECDTPAGHFGFWSRTVSRSEIDITGTLKVLELLDDKKWSPTAKVMLYGGADGQTAVGLNLFTLKTVKDQYFIELRKPGGHVDLGLGFIPSTKDPLPFRLHLDATGKLTVTLSGVDASTQLADFKVQKVSISCSTGDIAFDDVRITEK
jgi:hypothetical protein